MSKVVPKEVREYWKSKLAEKFSKRKQDLETMHHFQIQKDAEKNVPSFKKSLKLDNILKDLLVKQKAYQQYIKQKSDKEQALKLAFENAIEKVADNLDEWAKKRAWDMSIPSLGSFDRDDKDVYDIHHKYTKAIEEACYNETKKKYIESKAGKEIKQLRDDKERAMDIMHSDMISTDWLKAIQSICKSAQIPCGIPSTETKQLTN